MKSRFTRVLVSSLAAAALAATLASCGSASSSNKDGAGGRLTLWTHNAGNATELGAVQEVVDAFNSSQTEATITIQAFPQDSYNDSVVAAASANKLPCLVEIDGPNVPNWAWAKYLTPLKLSTDLSRNLPSTLGAWNGETYAVGAYDVALTFMARKSDLDAAGIRVATIDKPWTRDEFDAALASLKQLGRWDHPLDLGTSGVSEWTPYAYSPLMQSFGGDLINRDGFQSAAGVVEFRGIHRLGNLVQGPCRTGLHGAKERQGLHPGFH